MKYTVPFLLIFTSCTIMSHAQSPKIKLVTDAKQERIEVRYDDELFTVYHYSADLEKPLLWPVVAANGRELTRGYPLAPKVGERVDHPHHLGVWLNYGDVNGLDFWNNSSAIPPERAHRYGVIRHRKITQMAARDTMGILGTTAEWMDHQDSILLEEATRYTFSARGDTRIIDRETTLTAIADSVLLTDNKEGMFAIRVARELELPSEGAQKLWNAEGEVERVEKPDNSLVSGDYLSSEGISGGEVWGTRARWMKLSGVIGEAPVAIVIYDYPGNVGYPTYWHARGYGLFAANPLGQKVFSKGEQELDFRLKSGESVTFKYRMAIFAKDPSVKEIEALAQE